jgi:hypothetical protein
VDAERTDIAERVRRRETLPAWRGARPMQQTVADGPHVYVIRPMRIERQRVEIERGEAA